MCQSLLSHVGARIGCSFSGGRGCPCRKRPAKRSRAGGRNQRELAVNKNAKKHKAATTPETLHNKTSPWRQAVEPQNADGNTAGGGARNDGSDSDVALDLDAGDLQVIADVLQASTRQEQRIATESHHRPAKHAVDTSGVSPVAGENQNEAKGSNSSKLISKHALAKDHVHKGHSKHVPHAAHKQLYGSAATSFAELGLNEVRSSSQWHSRMVAIPLSAHLQSTVR